MKKFISIFLCIMMLVGAMSFSVSADETAAPRKTVTFGDGTSCTVTYDKSVWENNVDYVIRSGCTYVVSAQDVLNVPFDSTLTVEEGAHLVVNQQLHAIGDVFIRGKLTCGVVTGQQNVLCEVTFPALKTLGLDDKINVKYCISGNDDPYGDLAADLTTFKPANTLTKVMVPYGTFLFIRVEIQEAPGEDRYDDSLYPVYCNDVTIPFEQNSCPVKITSASEIEYGKWRSDSTYYNTYTITLPEGTGFTCYGRYGETGEVSIKYGNAFSFRVELDEEYNKSAYEVYVYNGSGWTDLDITKEDLIAGLTPAVADKEGYYTIKSVTGDYSIFVEGIIANEMLDILNKVFSIFKQVWEAVMTIFNEMLGDGGIGGLLGNLTV